MPIVSLRWGYDVLSWTISVSGKHRDNVAHLLGIPDSVRKAQCGRHLYVEGPVARSCIFGLPRLFRIDYLEMPIQTLKVGSLGTHKSLAGQGKKKAPVSHGEYFGIYGDPLVNPQPETYWGNVNPIGPRGRLRRSQQFAGRRRWPPRYHKMGMCGSFESLTPMGQDASEYRRVRFRILFVQAPGSESLWTVYGDGSQSESFCFGSHLVSESWRCCRHRRPGSCNTP